MIGANLYQAVPEVAGAQRLGPGRTASVAPGDFVQVEDDLSNFEAVQANRGKLDCWTTAWLADPAPGLRPVGHPEYRGEAWMAEAGTPVDVQVTPGRVQVQIVDSGRVVINQNAFDGWSVDGRPAEAHDGLLSAELSPGAHIFRYRPPGLIAGLATSALGLVLLVGCARRRAPGRAASSSVPPPRMDPPPP